MRCPSCMAENSVTRRFCAQCGAPLPSLCPACGFENERTAKFCGGCGKLNAETTTPAAALAARQERRRSGNVALRRAGHPKITDYYGSSGEAPAPRFSLQMTTDDRTGLQQ